MPFAGLTFIGQSQISARQAAQERQQQMRRRLDGSPGDRREENVSADERAMLGDIDRQLREHPAASDRVCPECERRMAMVRVGDVKVDACLRCEGVFFDPGELKSLTGLQRDVPGDRLASRPSGRLCPACREAMTEQVFLRPYNLLVDRCPRGHGVYLEKGELKRAFELTE